MSVRTPILRYRSGHFSARPDSVAGEEPLELRVGGVPLTVTMRTPGADIDLLHGFLHAEGLIAGPADVAGAKYCDGVDDQGRNTYNVLEVELTGGSPPPRELAAAARAFTTNSACGVCGKSSIDALAQRLRYQLPADGPIFQPQVLAGLPDALRNQQKAFRSTGGLHGAALARPGGLLELVREDVGRHNAVDKTIGAAVRAGRLPLSEHALVTSSRASFELVQKALMAGISTLVAVSAPSSLAVDLAAEAGMTLVGFVRDGSFNVYAGAERVAGALHEVSA